MNAGITREQAVALLRAYNHEKFHLQHALTVESVMRWYAAALGYESDADFWAAVGLLHDIDFENWPEEHCVKAPELLRGGGCTGELIHAVVSHAWGMGGVNVEPAHEMEKVLYAADELTGLIGAAALMLPTRSVQDLQLKSLKKKFKDKRFAAGCSRDVISRGAELLGWELDVLMERTIEAMRACEESVRSELAAWTEG